jgi:hypothetical protein
MVMPEFESGRRFQVWKYTVSHAMLLLRSVKDDDHDTRVDVLFVAVSHIDVPTTFEGLRIERTGDEFRLAGAGWHGSISAGNVAFAEDHGEHHEPSPFAKGSGI